MAEKETAEKSTKKVNGTFLQDRVVSIKAVESSGKWNTLLVKGQDRNKDPFLYNKVKRSYQVPLNSERRGGGVKVILDNYKKVFIKKYEDKYPEGMTEQQFFEEELGTNLNPTLPREKNFWRIDKRGRVTLTKKGLTLNLKQSIDMLRYKILLSNKMLVSPSYDERTLKATYEFMIVDEGLVTSRKVEEAELKSRAYTKYAEITANDSSMKGFIKALGRSIPINHTKDWLKSEVLTVLENSTTHFLSIVEDPLYNEKIFVQEAVEARAINRMSNKRYTLDTGVELGDLHSTVQYLMDPDNQEVRMRIKSRIELAKN
jgi:hypothetical protein